MRLAIGGSVITVGTVTITFARFPASLFAGHDMSEFPAYPKTPRLFRDVVITEKIDGTNALVSIDVIPRNVVDAAPAPWDDALAVVEKPFTDEFYVVRAGSRKRWLSPATGVDNYGFGTWVSANAEALAYTLGAGMHYGEWWGSGVQRGYGLSNGEKRFSLFNVARWADETELIESSPKLGIVPVLYAGPFSEYWVDYCLHSLRENGSIAAPGFDKPEGICIYHTAARQVFKVLLENDEKPKGLVA